jgi:hypothetical protein
MGSFKTNEPTSSNHEYFKEGVHHKIEIFPPKPQERDGH